MKMSHNRMGLYFLLNVCKSLLSVLFFVGLCFWASTLVSLHLQFPDEDLTPLATHVHTHSFLSTTVAQSDTVSLGDNRPLVTSRFHTGDVRLGYRRKARRDEVLPGNILYMIQVHIRALYQALRSVGCRSRSAPSASQAPCTRFIREHPLVHKRPLSPQPVCEPLFGFVVSLPSSVSPSSVVTRWRGSRAAARSPSQLPDPSQQGLPAWPLSRDSSQGQHSNRRLLRRFVT